MTDENKKLPVGVDDNEFSLSDMYDPRSKYTADEKFAAVMAYLVTGNSKSAAKVCNIPNATIRWWKASAAWWPDALEQCRKQKNDEIDAKITKILDKAVGNIADVLENGEEVATKQGEIVRKMPSGRDQTIIAATLFDKRNLIRGEPTSRNSSKTTEEILGNLLEKFEHLSNEIQTRKDPRVVNE